MYLSPDQWIGADLTTDDFAALTAAVVARDDVALLPGVLVVAERHRAWWAGDAGQVVLAGILGVLLDALDGGDTAGALAVANVCPRTLAAQGYDLLAGALLGDADPDAADLTELDDAAILTLALLRGASGQTAPVTTFLDRARADRDPRYFGPLADAIATRFAPRANTGFEPKLIVWDLDDTLWQGTLADGDTPVLDERRAGFVRAFNACGIVSAICSKNDFATARAVLEEFGLWDEFVFPRIAFVPKGAVVQQLIADMRLRPANVLFIDDNPHNLHAVAAAVPGITTMDATTPDCDALLQRLLDVHRHVARNRVADYRLLESRVAARADAPSDDAAFLLASGIHATVTDRMDNLEFADRIAELINRSNQLNYTASRIAPGLAQQRIQDVEHYDVLSVFVWDRYGYYGLVGAAIYQHRTGTIEHLAFSCRIMHMGVEDFLIRALARRGRRIAPDQLKKPLPPQRATAIRPVGFNDPGVRDRILAAEAPRDWSRIELRIMADCQSGAFYHYSRHRDRADYDNEPRHFSLPAMAGTQDEGSFPRCLVYAAATDYLAWRWASFPEIEVARFRACAELFAEMVVAGDRRCLLLLPPEDGPDADFRLHRETDPGAVRARHPIFNAIWRELATRFPAHFRLVELGELLLPADRADAHHYLPAGSQRVAGAIDGWYEDVRTA